MNPPPPPGLPVNLPPGYGAPPPRRSSRSLVVVVLVAVGAVFLALVLLGVVFMVRVMDDVGTRAQPSASRSAGPMILRESLRFQQVAEVSEPAPCNSGWLTGMDGNTCYRLEPGGMTVKELVDMRAFPPRDGTTGWGISLRLTSGDAPLFGALTKRAHDAGVGDTGNQIAIVSGEVVVSAPTINNGPITGGEVEITGGFTQRQAQELVQKVTGRTTA